MIQFDEHITSWGWNHQLVWIHLPTGSMYSIFTYNSLQNSKTNVVGTQNIDGYDGPYVLYRENAVKWKDPGPLLAPHVGAL